MKEPHPHIPPSLPALLTFAAGIASGRMMGAADVMATPWTEWLTHPMAVVVAVAALASIPLMYRRRQALATLAVLTATFFIGMMLWQRCPTAGWERASRSLLSPDMADEMSERREQLAEVYAAAGLQGDEYALVTAMTLGERQRVSSTLSAAYDTSGASHIFALSGLHLSVIYLMLSLSLPRRRFPHITLAVLLALLWAYAVLVGLRPSVVRAAVMLSIYTLITAIGRRTDGVAALVATAFLLLAVCPWWLFDVGFQMSFMAVLGISLFLPTLVRIGGLRAQRDYLYRITPEERIRRLDKYALRHYLRNALLMAAGWLWNIIALSLTAQVGVIPLIACYFGRFSTYAILANLLVSPLASLLIPLSFVLLALGVAVPCLPFLASVMSPCATLLTLLARLMNEWVGWIATLPGA